MPLDELLSTVDPTDDPDWPSNFGYIVRNHYNLSPAGWERFLASIQRNGIRTPITLIRVRGRLKVANGHHRVWAAVRLNLAAVPVRHVERWPN